MSAGQQNFSFVAGHNNREKMEEKELEVDDHHEDPIFLNRVIRTGMKEIGVESLEGNKFDELMVHIKKMCPGIDLNRSEKMNFIRKKIQNRLKYLERTQHARSDVRKRKDSLEKVEILTEDEMAVESLNKETVVSGESALEGPSNRMAAKGHQDVEDEEGFIDLLKAHSTPMKGSDHSGNHSTVELPVINKIIRTGIEMFDVKSSQDSNSDDLMKYIQKMFPDMDLNSPEMIDSVKEKIHNSLQCLGQLQPTRSSVGTGEANNTLAEILTENETAAESLNKETETVVLGVSALEGPSNKMDVEGHQDGDQEDEKDESDESDESEIFETLDNSALNTLVRKGIEKFKLKNLKDEKMDKLMKYIKKKCPSTEAIKPETTKEIRKKVSQRLRTMRFLQSGGPSYRRNSENATRGAETSLTLKTLKKLRFVPKPIPKDKLRAKLKVSLFHEGHAVATGKILQYPLQTYDIEDFKREEFAQLKITKIRKFTNVTVPVLPYPKDKRSWANMKKGNTIIWPLKDLCSHSAFLKNMRTGRLARQLQRSGRKSSSEISEILTDAKITAEAVAIQEKDLIMEVMNETSHDGDLEDVNVNNDSDSDYLEVSESDEFAESDESEILESLDKSSLNTLVRKGIEKFGVKTLKEEKTDKLMKYIQEKCPATDSPEMRKEIRKKISQRLRTWRCLQSDREYSEAAMRRTENTPDHLILKKLHFVPKLIPKDKLRAKLKVSLFNDGHAVALGEIIQYPLWKYDIEDSMREEFAQLEITKTRRYTRVPVLPYPKDKRSWEKIKKGNTIIWPVKDLHSLESYEKNVEAENLTKRLQRNRRSDILTKAKLTAESFTSQGEDSCGNTTMEDSSRVDNYERDHGADSVEEDDDSDFKKDEESDDSEVFDTLDKSILNRIVRQGMDKIQVESMKDKNLDKLMKYIQEKCPATDSPEIRKEIGKKISQRLRTRRFLQSDKGYNEKTKSENTLDPLTLKKLRFVPKLIPKDKLRAKLKVSLFNDGQAVALGEIIQYPLWKYDIEDSMREEFAQLEITKTRRSTRVPVLPYPKDKRSWGKIKKGNTIIWPVKDLHSVESYEKNVEAENLAKKLQRNRRSDILTKAKLTADSFMSQGEDSCGNATMEDSSRVENDEVDHGADSVEEDDDSDYKEDEESDDSEIFDTLDNSILNRIIRQGMDKICVESMKDKNLDKLMKYIQEKCPAIDSPETRKEIGKKISQRLRTRRFLQSDKGYNEKTKSENMPDPLTLKKLRFVPKPIPKDKLTAKLKVSLFHEGHAVATGKILQYPLQTFDIEDSVREEFIQLEITKTRRYSKVPVLPYPKDKRSWANMKPRNTIIWPVKDISHLDSFLKNIEAEKLIKKFERQGRSDIFTKAKLTAESFTSQREDSCGNTTMEDSSRMDNDEGDHGADSEDEDDDSHQKDEESDVPDILDTLEFVNNKAMNKLVRKGIEKFDVETMKGEKMDNLMEYIKKKCPAIDFNSREGRSMIRAKISMKLRVRRFLQSDRDYNENAKPKRTLNPMLRLQKLCFVPRPIPREKLRVKLKVSLFHDGHAVALGKVIQYPLQTYDIEDSLRNELVQVEIVKIRRYSTVEVLPYPKDNRSWSDIKVGKTIIWPVKDLCHVASFQENVDAENMAKKLQRGGQLSKHSSDISETLTKAKLTAESLNSQRKDGSGNSSIADSTMDVTDEAIHEDDNNDDEDGGDSDQSEVFETADKSSINKVIRRGLDKVQVKSMRDKNVEKVIGYIKEKCPAIDLNSPEMMKEVRKKVSQRIRSRNSLQSDRSYNEYAPPKGALPLPIERLYFVPKFVPKERLRPELEVSLFHDDHAVAVARIKQYPLEYDIDDSVKHDFVQVELTNIRRFTTVKVLPYPRDTRRWADLMRRSTVIWPVTQVCYKISYEENVRAENFAKKLQRNRNVFTEDARSVTQILAKARIALETMNPPVEDSTIEDEKGLGDDTQQTEEVIETVSLPKAVRRGMEKFKVQSMKENLDDLMNYIQKACPSVDLSIPDNRKKVKMKISQRLRHFRYISSDRFYAGESVMAARKRKFAQKEIPKEQVKPSMEVSLFNGGHAVATGKVVQYPLQHYDVEVTMRKEFALLEIIKLRRGSTVKELPYPEDGRNWKMIKKGSAVIWPLKDICLLASFQENIDAENQAKTQIRNRENSNKKKTSGGGGQITYEELGTSQALPTEQSTEEYRYGYSDAEDNIEDEEYFNDTEYQPPTATVSNQPATQETVNTPTISVFKKISATLSDELVRSVDQTTLNSVLSKVTEKLTLTVNWCPGNPTPEYTLTGRLEDVLLTQDMLYLDALKTNHPGADTAKHNNKSNTQGETSGGTSLKTTQRAYTNLYTLPKKRKHDDEKKTPKTDHKKKKDTSSAGGNVDTNCVQKSENMTKKGSQTGIGSSPNTNVKTTCHNSSVSVTSPTHSKYYSIRGRTLNSSAMEGSYQELNKLEESNVNTQSTNIGSTTQIVTPERIAKQGSATRVDGVHDDNPTLFVCNECNAVFNSFMEVETHVLLAHTDCLTKDGGYTQPQYVMDGAVVTPSVASQQIVDVYAQASMIINGLQDAAVHDTVTSNHHSV